MPLFFGSKSQLQTHKIHIHEQYTHQTSAKKNDEVSDRHSRKIANQLATKYEKLIEGHPDTKME